MEINIRHEKLENRFFSTWTRLVLRFRLWAILFTLVVTGISIQLIRSKLTTDMTIEAFLNSSSETLATLEEFRDLFGRDDLFFVMIEGDVFSLPFLKRLRALHNELAATDLKLNSVGQRLGERRDRHQKQTPRGSSPKKSKIPKALGSNTDEQTPSAGSDDDDFGDFDTDGDPSASTDQAKTRAGEWGAEMGGSIVDEIISLINVRRTRGRKFIKDDGTEGQELVVGELMKPWPNADQLAAIKRTVLADPVLVGQVVDKKGRYAVIAIRTQFMSEEDSQRVDAFFAKIVRKYRAPGFRTYLSGGPSLAASLSQLMLSEIRRLLTLSLIVVTIILIVLFRHPLAVIGPLSVVVLAFVWTFGIMAATGMPITMLTNVIPPFIICVGVGNSIHILSIYRDRRKEGIENNNAIISAFGTTGTPVFFTSLTTVVGLLSFQFATIDAIGDMGVTGAFGVLGAFFATLMLLPVFLSFNKKSLFGSAGKKQTHWIDRFLGFCASLSGRHFDAPPEEPPNDRRRRNTLIAVFVLSAVAIGGCMLLRVWHNPLSWISPDRPIRKAFALMDEEIGGTATIQIMIRSKSKWGVKDLRLLRGLEALRKHIHAFRHQGKLQLVGNSISLLDVIKETNRALHGGDQRYYRLPQTQRGLFDTLFLFEQAGPDQLRRLASADLKTTQITFRVRWLEATSYGPLTQYIDQGIKKHLAGLAEVKVTGTAYTLFMTVSSLIANLLRSFSVALVVIALIMILLLRNLRLGLIAMVPNLLPIVYIMGLMGFTGIPLDMANLLIASIAIGIAVDDTIHFLHHYREHYDMFGDVEAAITFSFRHSGRAMVGTSIILSTGFYVFLGATLLSLQRFGVLIGTTVILALLIDLIFSPALLRTFYRSKG